MTRHSLFYCPGIAAIISFGGVAHLYGLFLLSISELFVFIFHLVLGSNSLTCIFATPYKIRAG